jgi:precorrin-4/cobalt-precorrin-4 C11-methyltransferase
MDALSEKGIEYASCPGVSACFGAAASLNLEYTLPDVSQTLIITRLEGKTKVPEKEKMELLASHGSSMAIYLSAGMLEKLSLELIKGGYTENTPAAIVYKATWPEEKKIVCTIGDMAKRAKEENITKTAIVLVGEAVNCSDYQKSKLYDKSFSTEFREAKE